jgi:Immunity protein Imm1
MIVRYLSHQDKFDPLNGHVIEHRDKVSELLRSRRNQRPFIAELSGDNGFRIKCGIGTDLCCAQYSRIDGYPPYLMAVSHQPPLKRGCVEFLAANTATPFAAHYIITFDELKEIAIHFLETGAASDKVFWREFDPKACKEDAERPSAL